MNAMRKKKEGRENERRFRAKGRLLCLPLYCIVRPEGAYAAEASSTLSHSLHPGRGNKSYTCIISRVIRAANSVYQVSSSNIHSKKGGERLYDRAVLVYAVQSSISWPHRGVGMYGSTTYSIAVPNVRMHCKECSSTGLQQQHRSTAAAGDVSARHGTTASKNARTFQQQCGIYFPPNQRQRQR